MKRFIALAFLFVLGFATPAVAGVHKGPGVEAWLPDDWQVKGVKQGGEAMLVGRSQAEDAGVILAVAQAQNLQAAVKKIDAILAPIVSKSKLGKMKAVKVNGMPGFAGKGAAIANGKGVKVLVVLLETPDHKILIGVGMVEASKKAAYDKTFEQILASLKPSS